MMFPNWPPYAWRENDQVIGEITTQMKAGTMVGVSAGPSVEDWDFRAVLHEYSSRLSKYVHDQSDSGKPFFLYVPLPSPHTPIAPHESFQGKSHVSEYADFLMQTDSVVGDLMRALRKTKQYENTVVFFTCDNGTSPKANFEQLEAGGIRLNENWRGYKADAYEGGHRVPFVVRWPGEIEAGSESAEIITTADIMSTCAGIVGHHLPEDAAEDSVSLLPILRGEEPSAPLHDVIVNHSVSGHFAIRKGQWKLLFCQGSGGWSAPREAVAKKQELPAVQLYNLFDDPKETNNVQADYPEIVQQLTADLKNVVQRGRSTPGAIQPNHNGATWWKGLPWQQP